MSKKETILGNVRKQLTLMGHSEMVTSDHQPMLRAMWQDRQGLIEERNQAKKDAAALAAKPYDEALEQLDKRYAMLLKLSSSR